MSAKGVALRRGLYAITDPRPGDSERTLNQAVDAAIRGGARVIQYRDKAQSWDIRYRRAMELTRLCNAHRVPLLINDDLDLCLEVGAQGAHMGTEDVDPATARRRLGGGGIIGISCYNELPRAQAAVAAGASYVAFGSFFPSPTKPHAVRAPLSLLEEAKRELGVAVVAIGGITPDNGSALVKAGADLLAVVSDLFGAADVEAQASRFRQLYED